MSVVDVIKSDFQSTTGYSIEITESNGYTGVVKRDVVVNDVCSFFLQRGYVIINLQVVDDQIVIHFKEK